jgi:hypothetical protein
MLQWTCKRMAKIPTNGDYLLPGAFVYYGDIKMLDYLESVDMVSAPNFISSPKDVPTFKWLLKRGLAHTSSIYRDAVRSGNYEIVDYCIKKRFTTCSSLYRFAKDLKMVKYLWKRNVPVTESVWVGGFWMGMDEDVFIWYLRYPEIDHFNFEAFMSSATAKVRLKVLKWNAKGRYNNPTVIRLICHSALADDDILPLKVCKQLPYEYAICFDSTCCGCGNPANHEDRERVPKKPKC